MKLRAFGVLYTVLRPRATEGGEVFGFRRMPVASFVNGRVALKKLIDLPVERFDNFVALRNRKRAPRAKVILHIHNDEGLFRIAHT